MHILKQCTVTLWTNVTLPHWMSARTCKQRIQSWQSYWLLASAGKPLFHIWFTPVPVNRAYDAFKQTLELHSFRLMWAKPLGPKQTGHGAQPWCDLCAQIAALQGVNQILPTSLCEASQPSSLLFTKWTCSWHLNLWLQWLSWSGVFLILTLVCSQCICDLSFSQNRELPIFYSVTVPHNCSWQI